MSKIPQLLSYSSVKEIRMSHQREYNTSLKAWLVNTIPCTTIKYLWDWSKNPVEIFLKIRSHESHRHFYKECMLSCKKGLCHVMSSSRWGGNVWPGCLTSYGDDGIQALIPEGEMKVVTYHDFASSTPGNLYQWPTVVTAQGVHLAVHFKILSSPTTCKRKACVTCRPLWEVEHRQFLLKQAMEKLPINELRLTRAWYEGIPKSQGKTFRSPLQIFINTRRGRGMGKKKRYLSNN